MESPISTNGMQGVQSADATFINKVYFFFGLAILISAGGVYFGTDYVMGMIIGAPWMLFVVFGLELALIFTSRMWSTRRPLNYILFALFALMSGITVVPLIASFALEFGGYEVIIKALVATTFMFTASAIIGRTTGRNLQGLSGILMMGIIGMIIIGVLNIFFPWGNGFEMIYSGFGVLLFSAFVMYDIQKLKHYPEDRYIDAALALYLDIFNLFISILRLMGALRRN
ncbi:MAG: Bax inhibitor-1 family protein [Candidatus Peregrinibacteria bacterium]|nr:Bax inhibitor-1 family protein [Candidatus Peregrinibacteria bacterium]MDZ4244453.1 Bax inhibitor-1 family protein [Candidatus Gracilibacteria bacterium]